MFTDDRHHGFDETEMINLLNQQRLRAQKEHEDREEKEKDLHVGSCNHEKGFDFDREL